MSRSASRVSPAPPAPSPPAPAPGPADQPAAAADNAGAIEQLSPHEEVRRLHECWEKPEFKQMFHEYAEEVSDPAPRRDGKVPPAGRGRAATAAPAPASRKRSAGRADLALYVFDSDFSEDSGKGGLLRDVSSLPSLTNGDVFNAGAGADDHDRPVWRWLLAGPAGPHAHRSSTRDLSEVAPHRSKSRCRVLELRDLDLESGLPGRGPGCEDVEDEFAPVEHLAGEILLERLDLHWRQVVVEDHDPGREGLDHVRQLIDLALAEIGPGPGMITLLHESPDDPDLSRQGQGR